MEGFNTGPKQYAPNYKPLSALKNVIRLLSRLVHTKPDMLQGGGGL